MKTILCYGDSNTWGFDPSTGTRYPLSLRWPSVLADRLGSDYLVIPEGLNGRTTVWDDPIELFKNGATYLPPCLESHKPLDLVIIMLGTNDPKRRFSLGAADIAAGACRLASIVLKSETGPEGSAPAVLLVAPPPILETGSTSSIFQGGAEKSAALASEFERLAGQKGIAVFNAGDRIRSSPLDGIHLTHEGHSTLGSAIAKWISGEGMTS